MGTYYLQNKKLYKARAKARYYALRAQALIEKKTQKRDKAIEEIVDVMNLRYLTENYQKLLAAKAAADTKEQLVLCFMKKVTEQLTGCAKAA